uniref:Integrin beta n=1 Tax=Coturnix japonica TaxID=93934 RepID=A0A8C2UD30_COTJA
MPRKSGMEGMSASTAVSNRRDRCARATDACVHICVCMWLCPGVTVCIVGLELEGTLKPSCAQSCHPLHACASVCLHQPECTCTRVYICTWVSERACATRARVHAHESMHVHTCTTTHTSPCDSSRPRSGLRAPPPRLRTPTRAAAQAAGGPRRLHAARPGQPQRRPRHLLLLVVVVLLLLRRRRRRGRTKGGGEGGRPGGKGSPGRPHYAPPRGAAGPRRRPPAPPAPPPPPPPPPPGRPAAARQRSQPVYEWKCIILRRVSPHPSQMCLVLQRGVWQHKVCPIAVRLPAEPHCQWLRRSHREPTQQQQSGQERPLKQQGLWAEPPGCHTDHPTEGRPESSSCYKLFPSCIPSFGFRHLLSLTDKVDRFNEEVQKQKVSRNRDAPEGGFDAILQAAVCKEKIGWRKEASHLLVFTTDDVPHIALDGKLGGLVQPHDGQCHLNEANEYSASSQLDYPSLALLGEKLAENNIHLIFAVTKSHYVLYKNFTALIPGTTVEILHKDSKNIIELIVKAYNSIRSKVELTVWDSPEDIGLTFTATCQDGLSYPGLRKCGDLKIGDTVSFEVSVEARSCPTEDTSHVFTIKPAGFRDTLEVDVTYNCLCGCTGRAEPASSKCSSNGTYACGLCECNAGYLGARCECEEGAGGETQAGLCREMEGKPICSGRGECSCNQCVCYESEFGNIYGPFCECDDFSCARYKGVLCSGHGECHCGECKCHAGYIGDNCNCSTETAGCVSSDGQMCSGRGNCICGRCQCTEPGAFGETCEKCPTCPGVCSTKRDCIECKLFNSGRLDNQTCQKHCKDELITTVDVLKTDDPNAILCAYPVNNCVMKFTYSELASGKSNLTVLKEPACSSAPSAITIVLAVIGSVVLIGTILLGLWKLLVTIHDRREFDRFQSERTRARYEMVSALGAAGWTLGIVVNNCNGGKQGDECVCAVLVGTSGGQVYEEAFWEGFLAMGSLSI